MIAVSKGIHTDGHEREDVIAYRQDLLKRMTDLEARMPTVAGKEEVEDSNKFTPITWTPNGIRPLILYTYINKDTVTGIVPYPAKDGGIQFKDTCCGSSG
ncbi:unnamed protein product [Albugo candida]|uniref:Uncharacterized protein n=1 Tax=Albugo candida TaxID=65357 RepID=A0A024FSX4_9STRA|nr:unnamed protein product [Albugo candida]|eukprot:CCI10148.1 unnamed protein product [Albugo candida]